jgi:hypothetical protein
MTTEKDLQNKILLAVGRGDTRLFRNQVGTGWYGCIDVRGRGDVLIRGARPLRAGLCPGSSDLIGWRTVTVTPEMVGRRIAVFAAVEVKSARGRISAEQQQFLEVVRSAGGIAGVARSVEEARRLCGP